MKFGPGRDRDKSFDRMLLEADPFSGEESEYFTLPCGQCIGCRLEHARSWAVRCMHEAEMNEDNCFLTLTYSDEFLPKDGSLDVTEWQRFMKRLRKKFKRGRNNEGIRYLHCGEYGDDFGRPHYHACVFNHDFADKKFFKKVKGGVLYVSEELQKLWPYGFSTIGQVTFDSAGYCARYSLKKVNAHLKDYGDRAREYGTQSNGLGLKWLEKYWKEVYGLDRVNVVRDKGSYQCKAPRYYDNKFQEWYPEAWYFIKEARDEKAKANMMDNTVERLRVKEYIKMQQVERLHREYDKAI